MFNSRFSSSRCLRRVYCKAAALFVVLAAVMAMAPGTARAQWYYDRNSPNVNILTSGGTTRIAANEWDWHNQIWSYYLTVPNYPSAGVIRFLLPDIYYPGSKIAGPLIPSKHEWEFAFRYYAYGGSGGDGLAFVVRTGREVDPRNFGGIGLGGGLGYNGTNGFAIEFDTFDNGGGEAGIQAMLSVENSPTPIPLSANVPYPLRGQHVVRIRCTRRTNLPYWDNRDRQISVYMDNAPYPILTVWIPRSYLIDYSTNTGLFGLTAATGEMMDYHIIFPDWKINVWQ